jgi:hypothetical protein
MTAPSQTREALRIYMLGYMRRYRARIDPVVPRYIPKVRLLPQRAWNAGHCRRCGLPANICDYCKREIAA